MEMTDKTFFISGDIVTLNKDIDKQVLNCGCCLHNCYDYN